MELHTKMDNDLRPLTIKHNQNGHVQPKKVEPGPLQGPQNTDADNGKVYRANITPHINRTITVGP